MKTEGMSTVIIRDPKSGSTASIAVDCGFNCFRFVARLSSGESVDVIAAAEGFENGSLPASHNGIPILFPFTNRIRDGRFSWDGQTYYLPPSLVPYDNTGNAIHGFCSDVPWRIVAQQEDSVTGEFQLSVDAPDRLPLWPTDAVIQIQYTVTGSALRTRITVRNPSSKPLPWGFGTHPYFRVPLSAKSDPAKCTVLVPVSKVWELEEFLPTGRIVDPPQGEALDDAPFFDSLKVDAVYTKVRLKDGVSVCQIMDQEAGIQVEQKSSSDFRDIVVFTPPWMSAICMEPYTCVTDAINLQQKGIDAGLQILSPGGTWTGFIDIEAGPVVC